MKNMYKILIALSVTLTTSTIMPMQSRIAHLRKPMTQLTMQSKRHISDEAMVGLAIVRAALIGINAYGVQQANLIITRDLNVGSVFFAAMVDTPDSVCLLGSVVLTGTAFGVEEKFRRESLKKSDEEKIVEPNKLDSDISEQEKEDRK